MREERLTDKFKDGYAYSIKRKDMNIHDDSLIGEFPDKLGQLEDIEDKLNVGLVTIFNADVIWFRYNGRVYRATQTFIPHNPMFFFNREEIVIFGVKRNDIIAVCTWKGYGITWAFTKEELE